MFHRKIYVAWKNRQVDRFLTNAAHGRKVQHEVLLSKIRTHANSDFGRRHGFSAIRSLADFRRHLPLTNYEFYRPFIDRVKRGETQAMFGPGTRVLMFAMTSGTTDKSKYVPITRQFFEEYRRGWNLWGLRAYRDHPQMLRQFTVQISSNWHVSRTEAGIACGNISGLAAETRPWISRPVFIIPNEVSCISNTAAKQYTLLRLSITNPQVGMIMTANPSTLVELARLADREAVPLIRDVFDGTLSNDFDVPEPIRRTLRRRLSQRDPARARELEQLLAQTGHLYPRDFWPEMSLVAVWTGGSVSAYLPRMRDYFGPVPVRDHGLSASEGRMTIPFSDESSSGLLDYTTQFFEFIPEDEHDSPDPTVLEAHELEVDRNYYIVLTTSSGLYRYDIYDLVRCTGFVGEVPLIEFLNKGSHFSSITGEKLSEMQVTTAVKRAFADLDLSPELFSLAPQWGDPPGYVLLLEPGRHLDFEEQLCRCVDEQLARLNCEYANRLETRRLRPVILQTLSPGTWQAVRDERIQQRGGSIEQYKHRALQSEFQFLERIHELSPEVAVRSA